jgi:hypothetical protein
MIREITHTQAGCFSSRVDGMSRLGNYELRGARVGITHRPLVRPFAAITVRASRVVLNKRVCHGSNIVKENKSTLGLFAIGDEARAPSFWSGVGVDFFFGGAASGARVCFMISIQQSLLRDVGVDLGCGQIPVTE